MSFRIIFLFCLSTFLPLALTPVQLLAADASQQKMEALCKDFDPTDEKLALFCPHLLALIKAQKAANAKAARSAGGVHTATNTPGNASKETPEERAFNTITGAQPAAKPAPYDLCATPRLFVRADPLDDYNYAVDTSATKKGASLSFTDDYHAKIATFTTTSRISLVFGNPCMKAVDVHQPYLQGYAIAPWVSGNGTINSPQKAGEQSALKGGVEGQIAYHFPVPATLYASGSPYYQTDFRGQSSAMGGYLAVTPVVEGIALGESKPIGLLAADVAFLLRGEFDYMHVYEVGQTKLTAGDRPIVGPVGRLVFDLFRSTNARDLAPELADRVSFFVSGQYFYNPQTGYGLPYFSTALSYKIYTGSNNAAGLGGAVSLEYDRGYDKDTQVKVNQLLAKLTFAY